MFAYCNNNPVNYADPSGQFAMQEAIMQMQNIELQRVVVAVEEYRPPIPNPTH